MERALCTSLAMIVCGECQRNFVRATISKIGLPRRNFTARERLNGTRSLSIVATFLGIDGSEVVGVVFFFSDLVISKEKDTAT
jgi:hypothetical protein